MYQREVIFVKDHFLYSLRNKDYLEFIFTLIRQFSRSRRCRRTQVNRGPLSPHKRLEQRSYLGGLSLFDRYVRERKEGVSCSPFYERRGYLFPLTPDLSSVLPLRTLIPKEDVIMSVGFRFCCLL